VLNSLGEWRGMARLDALVRVVSPLRPAVLQVGLAPVTPVPFLPLGGFGVLF
jgi:hypothetical protein